MVHLLLEVLGCPLILFNARTTTSVGFTKSILAEILDLSFVAETSLTQEAAQRCASGEWLCRGGVRGSAHSR